MFLIKHSSKMMGCKFYRFLSACFVFIFFSSADRAYPAGPEVKCN